MPCFTEEWRYKPPTLIILFLGANDAAFVGTQQYIPLTEYQSNLRSMITQMHEAFPQCSFIFLTPPPVEDKRCTIRTNENTGKYAAACVHVATDLHIPVVDFYTILQGQWNLLSDGLHFNKDGNMRAHELILGTIRNHYPHLAPEVLPEEYHQE
jgi:lysophospholipase L1-like esterase